jgi:hypothetical protein
MGLDGMGESLLFVLRRFTNNGGFLAMQEVKHAVWSGMRQGMVFGIAVASAGLADFAGANPLTVALMATLGLVAGAWALALVLPYEEHLSTIGWTATLGSAFSISLVALGLLDTVGLVSAAITCPPQVPWRFSIAAFGSFALAWMTTALVLSGAADRMPLIVMLTLFWIAPFYGFFHGPWWLAMAMVAPCDVRSALDVMIAGGLMLVGVLAGQAAARWMFPPGQRRR